MNVSTLDLHACHDLLERLPVGLAVSDTAGNVAWVNSALCELLFLPSGDLVGAPASVLLGSRAEQTGPDRWRLVSTGAAGERRWLECTVHPLAEEDGRRRWLHCFIDISAFQTRGRARAAVVAGIEPSRLDPESGVLNRRAVLQELSTQVSRSRRYGNPLSVLLVRLGGVDAAARRRLAGGLRESLRWVDCAGALSVDDFLVVLPETGEVAACHVAEKLRENLAATSGTAAPVLLLGVATWHGGEDLQVLLDRVAAALAPALPVAETG